MEDWTDLPQKKDYGMLVKWEVTWFVKVIESLVVTYYLILEELELIIFELRLCVEIIILVGSHTSLGITSVQVYS